MEPQIRYSLKSKIIGHGFKNMAEFSAHSGIDASILSNLVNGKLFPGKTVRRRLVRALDVTSKELFTYL